MGDDGYANPIVGSLGALVRDWIRSRNYVAGVSGWQIEADGDAEFNNAVIRGELDIGGPSPPNPSIQIAVVPGIGPVIEFESGDASQTQPGQILYGVDAFGELELVLQSPEQNNDGRVLMTLVAPNNPAVNPGLSVVTGGVIGMTTTGVTGAGELVLDQNLGLQISTVGLPAVALADAVYPFLIGLLSGFNLRMDRQQIQAVNAGAAAKLFLNQNGGDVQIGGVVNGGIVAPRMSGSSGLDTTARSTASAAYVTAANTSGFTIPYPPTGKVLIIGNCIANEPAANQCLMDFEIRDTNAAGTLRRAATDTTAGRTTGAANMGMSCMAHITGLPTTGTMFAQAMVRVTGGTGSFDNLHVIAVPLP